MSDLLGLVFSLKFLAGLVTGSFIPAIGKGLKALIAKAKRKLFE